MLLQIQSICKFGICNASVKYIVKQNGNIQNSATLLKYYNTAGRKNIFDVLIDWHV